ncbi:MAG TPA: PEP/pyruvate-binding domain-containing protein [Gemmatimonadaceae bacterium]|jgi:pyruvate,water dikinase|nr:PEP/pyruvate-binding domain-containing protein [Gemmatimonadaceae bacterium]
MTTWLRAFTDPLTRDVSVAGGKGANLAHLAHAGFPVPSGAVVTPDAYRTFIAPIESLIDSVTRDLRATDRESIGRACEIITGQTAGLSVPVAVARDIEGFVNDAGPHVRWAVRSSGTAEDGAAAAFAGQHDTFLNRAGAADVIAHVKRCWLSLWSPRAIAYRARLEMPHLDIAMAVVLQQMVFSDVAGVAFSIDPVTGALDRVVINANFGLGESVVSGEADVDHLIVDKGTGRVIEQHLARKCARVVAAAHGTIDVRVDDADADRPALSDAGVADLTALIVRVEAHYGWPQDIEWAVAADKLWLLQSRPITTVPARWTRDESAERFPNPVTPFTWDFVEEGFHRSLNHSFALMGMPAYSGKWFSRFGGHIYGNQNAVELYARRSPAPAVGSLADLERQLPALLERFAWLSELPAKWHAALPEYLDAMEAFSREPVEAYKLRELWDFVERLNATGTAYFLPNIAISIGHGVLHRALEGLLSLVVGMEKAQRLAHALVQCETMTTRVNAELRSLATMARREPELASALRETSARDLWSRRRWATTPFWIAFRKFLDAHGHRETDFDALHPTWGDAPWVVVDQIRALLDVPIGDISAGDARIVLETMIADRITAQLHALARGIIELAREYTKLDDLEHYHTTRLSPPMRRAVLEIGRRLMDLGLLSAPTDAFFASKATLARACKEGLQTDRRVLVAEVTANLAEYHSAQSRPPDWELGVRSSDGPSGIPADDLRGIAGSPGVAEGVVHIVRGVEDFATFPKGAVLVARTTNPAWTPLFYSAAAVVTESGGPLSHGAVTAREMKIPAVMAVRGVFSTLSNGDRVRVDGARGLISLCRD